ncbi:SCO-spondin isoform X2 [Octopus bimaculoides]|uniref:SCO-spondin isoform X2 n=1 Tax=Octopus bimaculoides TaxID=37653 RepID=UPI0022E2CEF5|nr:SCO-spondin isoform X2 [Octopus bimaculoides]
MAALFKLYLFIWTMLSYNWVDRNLYSVAYNRNAESIDSDELEDYLYSRWHKKVPKPILKRTSGIVIKRDQTAWRNMPNRKHTPWVLLKSDMIRHNGDDDDDNYMLGGSSDTDEDDVSGEEEEEEEESMYDVNNHYNGDDVQSYYLLREKIYKDIDKLAHKCSLPLNTRCLSTVFYHVFKNLMKHKKNKENAMLKSKEQNVFMHQNPSPSKSLHQLLEDIFLKKYGFLPHSTSEHSSGAQNQNSSEEDRNKLLLKLISLIDENNTDTSKNLSTNLNADDHNKQTGDKKTTGEAMQSLVASSSEASMKEPQSETHKSMQSKWKKVKPGSRSEWKRPEIKISFNGNELNMSKNTYLGLEYFYKLIGILNDLKINFTYSPEKKAIFVNPQSLLAAEMQRKFLNIKNVGWQKRKPFKVQIDFHKNTANNSRIILKTSKNTKNDSDSSEIKIEFLQPVKNVTAKPTAVNDQSETSFTPQPNTMTTTTTTQPPPPPSPTPPITQPPPPPPTTAQPPPSSPPLPPPTTTNHSPMDVNININVNDKYINNSLTAGRKKEINITHTHTHPNNAYGAKRPTAPSVTHVGEWTVWYKWSPCSTSCGIGHRKRHRMCLPPGFYCPGNHSEKASCLKRHCNLGTAALPSGHLTAWNTWSTCSVTCGMGQRHRQRLCLPIGSRCEGSMTQQIVCRAMSCSVVTTTELPTTTTAARTTKNVASVKIIVPTGHWTIWQGWSQCSSSCGLGIRKRTRVCLPYGFHCEGDLLEMASCMLLTCDSVKRITAKVITITTKQTKATNPITTTAAKPTTTTTTANPTIKIKIKSLPTRPPPKTTTKATTVFSFGKWKAWHDWSACSVSCGYGIQRRERVCLNSHCIGFSTETVQCMERHCDSEWTPWNEWSVCSVTCGNGHRSRNRVCLLNSSSCIGVVKEVGPCVLSLCVHALTLKTNGHWTSWSDWSRCSKACNKGHRRRFRSCSPKGAECKGFNISTKDCFIRRCHKVLPIKTSGSWMSWSEWSHCSTSCSIGVRKRFHRCLPKGRECHGKTTDVKDCIERHCITALPNKTHSSWTSWSEWSHCSTTCDSGRRERFRSCLPKGSKCQGGENEEEECMHERCHTELQNKANSSWTSWSEWSHCSSTCDSGQRKRFRSCLPKGSECEGNITEDEECMHISCQAGLSNKTHSSWTSWSEWSHCSSTCDSGQRKRFRSCLPKGSECEGNITEDEECMHKPCQIELLNKTHTSWTSWSEWSSCSSTCDSGRRRRFRSCLPKGSECRGNITEEDECMHKPCHSNLLNKTHTSWTSWSEWSSCSTTCDSGRRRRFRSCLPKGSECRGNITEEDECMHKPCHSNLLNKTHTSWTSWSEWSSCSTTCDSGRRRRFRSCLPKGSECHGNITEERKCMHKPCHSKLPNKTRNSWTSWSEWSSCSTTCDSGQRRRFRSCLPKGSKCRGNITEEDKCMHKPCHSKLPNKSHNSWTSWTDWSHCSSSCGSGRRRRFRSCLPKGIGCRGNVTEEEECMHKSCQTDVTPMNGEWDEWSSWAPCSTSCGNGRQKRVRICLPNRTHCDGNRKEVKHCMERNCTQGKFVSTGGRWTQWTEWSNCSVACGSGQQKRRRTCQPVGHQCEGDISNVRLCMERSCFPGQWSKWGDWSQCSAACGRGQITKNRACIPSGAQCPGKNTERMICMKRSCDKENVLKPTSVLQGKFTKLKCCSQKNCHRSKYKWLMPDGKLIAPSNSSGNRFFAVNEYLIIEKTQKKDRGTYRCLKIDGNSAKGIELPLVVHTCDSNPCLNKGICKDTIFSPHRLYKTVCKCPTGYLGSVCQIDKTSPFSSKLAIILAVILIILFCVLLVILLVYFCYRRGKLKRCFDSKMNVLLEFNHDSTFNPSDDNSRCPPHKGLNKTEFYTSEKFYPESIIRTTTIDAMTEGKEWRTGENPTSTPS